MFEDFNFSSNQIAKYYKSALRDLDIASNATVPEVAFRFCYDALMKLAIAVCAKHNLRVKAKQGHHVELIKRLARFLDDKEIEIFADEMRAKRNWDLYGGGVLISRKETESYLKFTKFVFRKAEDAVFNQGKKLI